jgi:FHA domain-containing protein
VLTDLVELARMRSRSEFLLLIAPQHFLVLDRSVYEPSRVAFTTRVARPPARPALADQAPTRLVAIAKAPGNPYPERIAVGRARNCDVVLRDPSVSKLHAHFTVDVAPLQLVDVGSHNGTRVNGRALSPARQVALVAGDVIAFGDVGARLVDATLLYDLLREEPS